MPLASQRAKCELSNLTYPVLEVGEFCPFLPFLPGQRNGKGICVINCRLRDQPLEEVRRKDGMIVFRPTRLNSFEIVFLAGIIADEVEAIMADRMPDYEIVDRKVVFPRLAVGEDPVFAAKNAPLVLEVQNQESRYFVEVPLNFSPPRAEGRFADPKGREEYINQHLSVERAGDMTLEQWTAYRLAQLEDRRAAI